MLEGATGIWRERGSTLAPWRERPRAHPRGTTQIPSRHPPVPAKTFRAISDPNMVYPLNIKAFLESACSHLNPPRNPSNRRLLHLHQIQSTSEMESATPSKRAKTAAGVATPQKMGKAAAAAALADQFLTPEKPMPKVAAAAAAAEQIWTPEKPKQPSAAERRARSSGGVAFSVKGVRRAALELRRRSERGRRRRRRRRRTSSRPWSGSLVLVPRPSGAPSSAGPSCRRGKDPGSTIWIWFN